MLENGARCWGALLLSRSRLSLAGPAPGGRQQLQRQPAAAEPPALGQCDTVAGEALFSALPQQLCHC